MRFLPGLLENLPPQVDGIVALDDGSTDGSGDYVAGHPKLAELVRVRPGHHAENEDGRLRRLLITAGWEHDADWFLGIDADERLERGFRERAELELERADAMRVDAIWVPFREMWTPRAWRADGVWGKKRKCCLFRSSRTHRFDEARLHSNWASLPEPVGGWPLADLRLYHLRMIEPEDRAARRRLYERLDPERRWQEIGYEYLTDETSLELVELERGREFEPAAGT